MRKTLLILASLALAGCGAPQAKSAGEAGVAQFHQMLDAGRYHDIYAGASPEFRNATSEAQLASLLQAVHDRLGAVGQARETAWNYNYSNGVASLDLTYDTSFASGTGTETFVYKIDGGRAALLSYDIHSDALRAGATANRPPEDNGSSEEGGEDAKPAESGGE